MDTTPTPHPETKEVDDVQTTAPAIADLLGDMIEAESEEVDWPFVRRALESHAKAHFEREIRVARERVRAIHAATSPYLINDEKETSNEPA